MRSDMSKVIVERPRLGSRANNDQKEELKRWQKQSASEDYLLAPRRGSSARGRRKDWKNLNEFLSPLRRFLEARVGQHWDKIYAEIRSQINPNNTVQMHIMQHLVGRGGYVETNVTAWPDGTFTTSDGKPIYGYFVNPKTGCLARSKDRYPFRRFFTPPQEKPPYVIVGCKRFREVDGIWYEFDLRPVPLPPELATLGIDAAARYRFFASVKERPSPPVFDIYLRCWPTYHELRRAHGLSECGHFVYAASKRQLNKKEIKQYKLRPQDEQIPASQTRR